MIATFCATTRTTDYVKSLDSSVSLLHTCYVYRYEHTCIFKRNSAGESHQTTKEMDLSKAKWDVRRFGTSGLTGASKEESKLEMLVKLGAKVRH